MGERKVVDFSRFLLFEAAGDSEVDFDDRRHEIVADKGNEDDDDAESCIYDASSHTATISTIHVEILQKNEHDDKHHRHHHDVDDEMMDDGMSDGDEGCIGRRDILHHHHHLDEEDEEEEMTSEVTSTANSYPSRKCIRSSKRKMSEIEKSRLFWEACLAS